MLDEADTVGELVERIRRVLAERGLTFEIVLVDDGSRDATPQRLRELEAADERVRAYEMVRNFGQNTALACGLFHARGDVVVTMDGDLQNPPEEIPRLLDALGSGIGVVTGKRGVRYESVLRWLGSRALHWLAHLLVGSRIDDFGGNFRAYRRSVVEAMRSAWVPGKPLLPLAIWLGAPIAEVAVRHDRRHHGRSRYTVPALLRINIDLVTNFTTAPLVAMGVAGAIAMGAGLAGILWYALRPPQTWFPAALCIAVFLAGSVFTAAGILGQYLRRVFHQMTAPPWVLRAPVRSPSNARAGEGETPVEPRP